MHTYRTNSVTKSNIIKAARKLFYDNGYKNTSIAQIAEALDISKGLITYHFKTKFELANAVYDEYRIAFIHRVNAKINQKHPDFDQKYFDSIQLRSILRLYRDDIKARRFYVELAPEILTQSRTEHYKIIYNFNSKKYHYNNLALNEEEMLVMEYAASAAITAVRLAYLKHETTTDYDFIEDSCIRVLTSILNIDNELAEDILEQGRELTDSLNIKFEPYFIMK